MNILREDISKHLTAEEDFRNLHLKTKIVCTLGPVSKSEEMIDKLIDAGLSVARMNFSHGDHDYHRSVANAVKAVRERKGTHTALLLDTKGPEIRSGKLRENPDGGKKIWKLTAGERLTFTTDTTHVGDNTKVAISYRNITKFVSPGRVILCSDGNLQFRVENVTDTEVECTILNSGELGETKGCNLPGSVVDLPAVTEKDKEDIAFGVTEGVDFIAASFIRTADNVHEIRNLPGVREAGIQIISKIESQQGLDNFDEILAASDGIMVARGDLGVEIPIEKVATAQKMMIRKCNDAGKIVITATQMLDSMERRPRPTRAEATDVANAVYDGTDCVMLSGETANGLYPLESVRTMADICRQAERDIDYRALYWNIRSTSKPPIPIVDSIASSAVKTAWDIQATLIIALTKSGHTTRVLSKYRPHCPIICITDSPQVARQLKVSRATYSYVLGLTGDGNVFGQAVYWAKRLNMAKTGDKVVIVSGQLLLVSGTTDVMKVITVD